MKSAHCLIMHNRHWAIGIKIYGRCTILFVVVQPAKLIVLRKLWWGIEMVKLKQDSSTCLTQALALCVPIILPAPPSSQSVQWSLFCLTKLVEHQYLPSPWLAAVDRLATEVCGGALLLLSLLLTWLLILPFSVNSLLTGWHYNDGHCTSSLVEPSPTKSFNIWAHFQSSLSNNRDTDCSAAPDQYKLILQMFFVASAAFFPIQCSLLHGTRFPNKLLVLLVTFKTMYSNFELCPIFTPLFLICKFSLLTLNNKFSVPLVSAKVEIFLSTGV